QAFGAVLEVLADKLCRRVIELAQSERPEGLLGRMQLRKCVHWGVSGTGSGSNEGCVEALQRRKDRFAVEPFAKIGDYRKRSRASSLKRLKTRDLARMTAFSERPSSSATRAAGAPSMANRRNAIQVVGLKSLWTTASSFWAT